MDNLPIKGLNYKIVKNGVDDIFFQIVAKKDENKPRHGGNMHCIGDIYSSREEAQKAYKTFFPE